MVTRWLRGQKYEVFSVYEEARGMDDDYIIQKAFTENWILITNDEDFGEKVYRERHSHKGIILLCLEDKRAANKIRAVRQLLEGYIDQLPNHFAVVTEDRVRFARI